MAARLWVQEIRGEAQIGVSAEERSRAQGVLVSVELGFAEVPAAVASDALEQTVDYAKLCERVRAVCQQRPYQLLERLAGAVLDDLLAWLPRNVHTSIEVRKAVSPLVEVENCPRFRVEGGSRRSTALLLLRPARAEDAEGVRALISLSARSLGSAYYDSVQLEAALGGALGLDTQLIQDGTYFVIEQDRELVASGGWSYRATRFGGDSWQGRAATLLDPARDAARIRAFFVHPEFARRGLATALLRHCEACAKERGYRSLELTATLPGEPFYRRYGYSARDAEEHPLGDGVSIRFVPMSKAL